LMSRSTWFSGRHAVLVTGGAFTLAAPLLVGIFTRDVALATLAAACGAFVTLLAKVDDLVELSLGPVKARMRETIEKAAATIDQLQNIALVSARAQLTSLMSASFISASNLAQRLEVRNQVVGALEALGIPKDGIAVAETEWRKGVGVIFHRYVQLYLTRVQSRGGVQLPVSATTAAKEIEDLLDFRSWTAPSPEQIRSVLDRHGIVPPPELDEWLLDYRHYLNTNEIRNVAKFVER
jgi:hypothetical protein